MVGDQLDDRSLWEQADQGAGDRAGGLAAADHAHLDRPARGERRPGRPEAAAVQDAGMVVGLARQPQRRPRSGQDQPVAVERQRLTGGRAPGRQPPAAVGQVDADDLGQDRLHPELLGHPAQVPVPGTMVGAGLAAVDPVGQAALADQVALPGPAAHLVADLPGGRAPAGRVRKADVLLGRRAERLAAVGVAGGPGPVGGHAGPVDEHEVGHLPAGPGQGDPLGRDGQPLGPGPDDGEAGQRLHGVLPDGLGGGSVQDLPVDGCTATPGYAVPRSP